MKNVLKETLEQNPYVPLSLLYSSIPGMASGLCEHIPFRTLLVGPSDNTLDVACVF